MPLFNAKNMLGLWPSSLSSLRNELVAIFQDFVKVSHSQNICVCCVLTQVTLLGLTPAFLIVPNSLSILNCDIYFVVSGEKNNFGLITMDIYNLASLMQVKLKSNDYHIWYTCKRDKQNSLYLHMFLWQWWINTVTL